MRFVITICIVLSFSNGIAQYYFNNTYNNSNVAAEISSNILLLENNNYLVPSISAVVENGYQYKWNFITESGELMSTQQLIDTTSILYAGRFDNFVSTADGGYVQTQTFDTGGILKWSSDGDLEWQISIDSLISTTEIIAFEDSTYLFIAQSSSSPTLNIFRCNSDGAITNQSTLTPIPDAVHIRIEHSRILSDKSLILGGYAIFWPGDVYYDVDETAMKIDSLGNLIWIKQWNNDLNDQQCNLAQGDNDSLLTIPFKEVEWFLDDEDHEPFTARMGTMILNINSGDTTDLIIVDMLLDNPYVRETSRTLDGGYIMMGGANDAIHSFTFLMKLDSNRELEWFKKYAPEPPEIDPNFTLMSYDIEITADSGFVVCGEALDWGNNGPNKQMPWIFKTDQCGELEWNNCGAIGISSLPTEPF